MNLLASFREKYFWTVDALKGRKIKNHINEISFINNNYYSKKAQEEIAKNIDNLVKHAIQTTSFYKNITGNNGLQNFPVINKNVVRSNYEEFKSSLFHNKNSTAVFTGGSTGAPLKLLHNYNKRVRHIADNLFYANQGGYKLGGRLYLIRAWHKKNTKTRALYWKKNIIPYAILEYGDKDMENFLSQLKRDRSKKHIVCFASMCEILVNYLDSIKALPLEDLNIESIITDGDSLSEKTKLKMEYYFQTPTVARYGNMECGIMGQQSLKGGLSYSLNWASYHFEVLKLKEDIPADKGELGRIVVTDLFNYCMPLIRYDTGDLAILEEIENNTTGPIFKRIDGRLVDLIYNTKGVIISPYIIVQKMMEYIELKQFQFAQTSDIEYVFRVNPWSEFKSEKSLINDSKKFLGNDAIIKIEYVDEVPLLSSGKRKQVVNEIPHN